MRSFLAVNATLLLGVCLLAADSWPQFRGPGGDGISSSPRAPIRFGVTENVTWKTEIPGRGWSSPVVEDGLVWITTAIAHHASDQQREAALKKIADRSRQSAGLSTLLVVAETVDLKLIAVDFESGRIARTIDLATIELPEAIHPLNTYASPTPVIDGDSIYCHFGQNGTFCVDRVTGNIVWRRKLSIVHNVGAGSSPIITGDHLIVILDGVERQYVTALDKRTGETVWETDRPAMSGPDVDMHKAFSSPIAITDQRGRNQLVCLGPQWIVSYDVENGDELWRCRHGEGYSMAVRPLFFGNRIIFSTGYSATGLWAIQADLDGDITDTGVDWIVRKGVPTKPSPILHEGLLYLIDDGGVASCLDTADGQNIWTKRIRGEYSASILFAAGHLYYSSHEGRITVVKAGRDCEVVAVNELDGRILASPAVIGQSLLVRTETALFRFDEAPESAR